MFYGGRLVSNLSFEFEWFNNEVILLLRINRNAFLQFDRDGRTMNTYLNETNDCKTCQIPLDYNISSKAPLIESYLGGAILRAGIYLF